MIFVLGALGCASDLEDDDGTASAGVDAERRAAAVEAQLAAEHAWEAVEMVRIVTHTPRVELLGVTGVDNQPPAGVTLTMRVEGMSQDDLGTNVSVFRCYELALLRSTPTRRRELPCPAESNGTRSPGPTFPSRVEPTPVVPPPVPADVDDRLRAVLTPLATGPVDEHAVRAAVDNLGLDPDLDRSVYGDGAVVGVGIRADESSCVLARVAPGEVRIWRPTGRDRGFHCSGEEAAHGVGDQPLD
ncbi:hypothetical protein R8Z50_25615 [Longispora sp. K20-0274]|uniref:hypothetical protein n=1 Tax=Longispora sp. K20-0274 TaxID=3088255 RepID=UPI00399997F8